MNFKIISLFTGGGGLDLGFEAHGFDPLVCVDYDSESCKTIRHNRPEWPVFEGVIEDFCCTGNVHGVIGGPPCQGFSTAGKGNPNDPRNNLWKHYFRIVEETKPLFIVLENVPGMLNAKNKHHFEEMVKSFEAHGYRVNYSILNASDFGVPQNRRRLVLVGGLGFEIKLPSPTVKREVTVREAIEDLLKTKRAPNHEPNKHAPHVVARWKKLKEGESDPNYRRARLYADRPSSTIRAGGGYGPNDDHLAGFHPPIHYKLPRQLTVRESARIQGFPDSWIFCGSKTAQGRQVGNAVPPPLANAVAKEVRKALTSYFSENGFIKAWLRFDEEQELCAM
ncbi:DNA cytosine methyltransferase [Desulfovibrio inopinatus]|uniref:DNA cytosine methyltransferase n=1 Tax=Desulfovibrio inopinatus TaxID=102109 RepID=UPI00040E0AA9|nr:DNA cytosine methyltransferase [Desulfovibrio inopinatus]